MDVETDQVNVAKYVIETLNSMIDGNAISKIEHVLTMIANNLTYDDPGLLYKILICNERGRLIQSATICWVIHHMIWLSNEINSYSSSSISDATTNVQTAIMSASLLKQPALCDQLVNKYIELTDQLLNGTAQSTNPLNVTLFQIEDFDLKTINENGTYRPIKISDMKAQNHILMANVRILSRICILMVELEKELVYKGTLCLLNAFVNGNLQIKSKCLRYFTLLFKNTIALDERLQNLIINIINGINEIADRITLWMHHKLIQNKEIEKFVTSCNALLSSQFIMKHFNVDSLRGAVDACLKLIRSQSKNHVKPFEPIVPFVHDFVKVVMAEVGDSSSCKKLFHVIKTTFDGFGDETCRSIELLGIIVLNEMKDGTIQSWYLVDEKLNKMMTNSNSTGQMIMEQLKCLHFILKTAQYIEHKLTVYLQRQLCETMCLATENESKVTLNVRKVFVEHMNENSNRLFSNLTDIGKFVLKNFSELLTTKYNPLVDTTVLLLFADIAVGILSIYGSYEIEEYLQSKLMLFAFCPFVRCSELLFNHLQMAFERETVRINKIMEAPFVRDSINGTWQTAALQSIVKLNLEYISTKNKDFYMDFLGQIFNNEFNQSTVLDDILNILINCVIQVNTYGIQEYEIFLNNMANNPANNLVLSQQLQSFYCLSSGNSYIFQVLKGDRVYHKIICLTCHVHLNADDSEAGRLQNLIDKVGGKFVRTFKTNYKIREENHLKYFKFFASKEHQIRAAMTFVLPSILNHLDMKKFHNVINYCLDLLVDNETEVRVGVANHIGIFPKRCDNVILQKCQDKLVQCVQKFLASDQKSDQSYTVQLITSFAKSDGISETMLLNCFRMMLYFCISSKSLVSRQAHLCANEMCFRFGITPKNLLIWYKTAIFKLIVTLCADNYENYNIGLRKSTTAISELFGCDRNAEFISDHYGAILVTLIPWSMKFEKCLCLIDEICEITQKDISSVLCSSFLKIYSHLSLHETPDVKEKSMKFILSKTDNSLYNLLKTDTKQTTAEVLIYYHLNPEFVMKTFGFLLNDSSSSSQCDLSTRKLAEYLKTRFLGVICNFEQILINDNEKSLKRQILMSIGEIMRVMGSENITQFRFKLLAVLRAALTINQADLKDICAQIWKIFISTVDLLELGPLLSTIFVSIEPLLETHPAAVNEILKYLIIDNGNLLSTYIADLFFVQQMNVSDDVKRHCQRYTKMMGNTFMEKFTASIRYINHDNSTVRIYGLNYLTDLFEDNRKSLNELIIGQQEMHPIIENLIDTLMMCIKSADPTLQTAAGRCLGKLAAIEPSHLTRNYRPQQSFARAVDSDEFAINALTEFCAAYQSQTDTKNVDYYSFAIQEILQARKVCPQAKQNMNVWQAIPERMRSLAEPLLSSCYVITHPFNKIQIHPIFGSHKCNTYEEWALTWTTKTIDAINDESVRKLLLSFRPSMRIDMNILSMALPYAILHAIQTNDPDVQREIAEEFSAVAEFVINPSNKTDDDANKIRYKTIKGVDFAVSQHSSDSITMNETIDVIAIKCAKLMFHQLDFLDRWMRSTSASDKHFEAVKNFIGQFNQKILATANYACGEYARALRCLEAYIDEDRKGREQTELSFLFQIYAELMDPDSLEGALNMKDTDPTLAEQVLRNSVQGRLQESTVCFERMMQVNGMIEDNTKDLIQCYLGLDQPETAILLAEGLIRELHDKNSDVLLQSSAEPLWRLGRFDELEQLIERSNMEGSSEWGIRCGQILLDFRKDDKKLFEFEVNNSRLMILKDLRIVGDEQNCYHKGYSHVMKLHSICEIEQAHNIVSKIVDGNLDVAAGQSAFKKLFEDWDERLHLLQPAARVVEPVICLRRIVLNEAKSLLDKHIKNKNIFNVLERNINDYIGASWIKSIELAREDGMHQQADLYILNAETYHPQGLFIEQAKLLWAKGDQTNSRKVLERGIEKIKPNGSNKELQGAERLTYAEAKFLIAYYNAESLNINTDLNRKYFEQAYHVLRESEKVLVHYAQYLDKALAAMQSNEPNILRSYDLQIGVMQLYFKSMLYGTKYIYQSMPRVLSIWFDFTSNIPSTFPNKKHEERFKQVAAQMNKMAEKYSAELPAFIFFTAFSQLVSRICHPSNDVYNGLKMILVKLISSFPQQSLWMILSVYKSSYANRVRRCSEVFTDKRLATKEILKLIQDFNSLAENMIELTNKELPKNQMKFSVKQVYPQLPSLLSNSGFSKILLPIQKYLQPVRPALHQQNESVHSFNAFPNEPVYIVGMKDELTVLPSLQRPRRVTLCGSDGKKYIFMMKPKDDLRKDFRLMEFNSVVKQYLHENSESRQRRLNIRTYAVVPLNEECGILEWVPNLQAFRHIVNGYYKQKKLGMTPTDTTEAKTMAKAPLDRRREWFQRTLKKYPPVFSDWFLERFSTPYNWYQARNSYVRTTAVMSIVGYILGLGDRHGENILFDSDSGDTVHVDFNCLFNKGETFEVPEVVPFRLTQNMVHAMGPLGIEGPYRKCCEITLKVLQDQTPTLMSVLRPFVYDPLVGWSRQLKCDGRSERTDAQAMKNVQHIEERLKGYVKINSSSTNMPLSTEGVVNHCILEATDPDKLSSMYIGWGAYM